VRRHQLPPRPDWQRKVEEAGLTWHTHEDGRKYWDESVAYEFSAAEVDTLEEATNELHRLCLAAADHVVANPDIMDRFLVPRHFRDYVANSRKRGDPYLYGRFDLAWDPAAGPPKMLEYNADTPTTLLETAVVQWYWLEEARPGADQFNSVHDRLIERWREIGGLVPPGARLHLSAYADVDEERVTVEYLADTLQQAGLDHKRIALEDVGWNKESGDFVDTDGEAIRFWFKLYPWEWLIRDKFAPQLLEDRVGVIEPPWKMLLSNKAILPLLWEMFPDHPNLLPASHEPLAGDVVVKPVLAREGANIQMRRAGTGDLATTGPYQDSPRIWQRTAPLARFDGNHLVIGSWTVGDDSAGMILREDKGPITGAGARVVPHFFT
jgi:glutathionylspermidine synthase